jgi:hypothetical protein
MNRPYLLILLALVLFSFSFVEDPLEKLIAVLKRYREELPQEKVYLHADRPYYMSGDTIWLKTYVTWGAFHEPSSLSKAVYVELLDELGERVTHMKLWVVNGSATGDIPISDTLRSGSYMLRAYTQWMRNNDEAYFFHKPVKIWRDGDVFGSANAATALDVQFFPEGGDLVTGILSRVGVKAVGADGRGREIKGSVVDDQGIVITPFRTNVLGMGSFSMLPQKGKRYRAILDGISEPVVLPEAKASGVVLSVRNPPQGSELLVRIQATDYQTLGTVYLLAQTRGVVAYAAKAELTSPVAMVKIPKKDFLAGVSQITVFDGAGVPLAERLAFVNDTEQLSISVTSDKKEYQPREQVTLTIEAKDAEGTPVQADLSVAVCDDQRVLLSDDRETIVSSLLLSSELRGRIESPGYYFNTAHSDRLEALDNLMLTQGWRRFALTKAFEPTWTAPAFPIERGITLRGKMLNKHNDKPIADGKVTYLAMEPMPDTRIVRTNEHGEFEIRDVVYFDSAHVILNGETRQGNKSVRIVMQETPFVSTTYPLYPLRESREVFEQNVIRQGAERRAQYSTRGDSAIVLKEVEIKTERADPNEGLRRMYGRGTATVNVEGNQALELMIHPLQVLQGRVAGVQVVGSGLNWSVKVRGVGSINSGTTPLIMIDNVPVAIETLGSLPVNEIESVDVFKGPDTAIFGSRGANGVIIFYTRRGRFTSPPERELFTVKGTGFRAERQFYSPKYGAASVANGMDTRITLHWAPLVQTDSTGRATVVFYNHDQPTTITTHVEGLSANGIPGRGGLQYVIREQ